jgi:hypothetical protein
MPLQSSDEGRTTKMTMERRLRYLAREGRQGGWLVEVKWEDGTTELLPTAHKRFYDFSTKTYRRTDNSMEQFNGKLTSWKERIHQTHKVVLTDDEWGDDVAAPPKRKGYLGVFDIDELESEGSGATHSFKIINRYQKTSH